MYINCQDICRHGHGNDHHEENHSHHHQKPSEGIGVCPYALTCQIAQSCPMMKEMLLKSSTQYNIEKINIGNRDIDTNKPQFDAGKNMTQFEPYNSLYPHNNYYQNYPYPYYPLHPMHPMHPIYPMHPMHPNYPLHPYYPMHPQYPMHEYYPTYPNFQQGRIDSEVEEDENISE